MQKKFLSLLSCSEVFFNKYRAKWNKELKRVERNEGDQEEWKNKRAGYIYILILLAAYKFSGEENKLILEEL